MLQHFTDFIHLSESPELPHIGLQKITRQLPFSYPYKNGELFGLHLGSFGTNENALIARMQAETLFFNEQRKSLGIWMDFYQTRLTDRVIGELLEFLRKNRSVKVDERGAGRCDGKGNR